MKKKILYISSLCLLVMCLVVTSAVAANPTDSNRELEWDNLVNNFDPLVGDRTSVKAENSSNAVAESEKNLYDSDLLTKVSLEPPIDCSEDFFVTQSRSIDTYNKLLASFSSSSYSVGNASKHYPDYYGGAQIDKITGELVILLTEDSFQNKIAISSQVENEPIRYKKCNVSYNQILAGYDAIIEKVPYLRDLGIIIDGAGDDLENGKVVVAVQNLTDEKIKIIQDTVDCDIMCFENSHGSVKETSTSVGGGSPVTSRDNNATSTLCFAAKRGSTKGFVIAGHAGDFLGEQFTCNGTNLGTVTATAYYNGTTADAAFVTASSSVLPVPTLVTGDIFVSATSERLPEGTMVYKYGNDTQLTSGHITDASGFIIYDINLIVTDCYKADYVSAAGDSGSPVMIYEGGAYGTSYYSLCGIHSGTGPLGGKAFSPYSNIVDELGVTCITGG